VLTEVRAMKGKKKSDLLAKGLSILKMRPGGNKFGARTPEYSKLIEGTPGEPQMTLAAANNKEYD